MKAQELRIGNIIFHIKHRGQPAKVVKVWGFTERETFSQKEGVYIDSVGISGVGYCSFYIDQYKPIPLSEEWLEKFGFNIYGNYERIRAEYKGEFLISKHLDFDWEHESCKKTTKYVHQLQNLYFALTGEELTIKELK